MIPFKDDNPTERFPVVTVTLIIINVLVFLYQLSLGREAGLFIRALGATPFEVTHMIDQPPLAGIPVPLTVITAMFIHGGFLHLGGNMLYLWIFGDNVEDAMGRVRFLIFYLVCGVAASALHIAVDPGSQVPVVGASGAIAGVLGAYLVLYPQARVYTLLFLFFFIQIIRLPAVFVLGFWFFLQILYGLPSLGGTSSGGVAWFAHVGGFLAGLILVKGFIRARPARRIWYFQ